MPRGGKREGSGRKPGKTKQKRKVMSIPADLVDAVNDMIERYKESKHI